MTSAFGIDHEIEKRKVGLPPYRPTHRKSKLKTVFGIKKSMVGGGHYIPANKLTPGMKNLIRIRMHPANKDAIVPGKKVQGVSAKGRELYPDHGETRSMNRKISTDVLADHHKAHAPEGGVLLGHSQPNGRGGGILRMDPHQPNQETTYKHELAHLQPKRNPYRFFERTSSSDKRLGREEGRADYTAHQKRTPGSYPGSKEFQRGYDEVQTKMHRAKQIPKKPRTFKVDSQGTVVRKSAFGIEHGVPVHPILGKGALVRVHNSESLDGHGVPHAYKKLTGKAKETGAEAHIRDHAYRDGNRNKRSLRIGPLR